MNERIKELAKQAGGNPNYKAFRGYFLPPPPDYIDPATVDLGKFAELIVRECVAQIEIEKGNPYRNMGDENRYGIGACVESIRRIKQHFGVE